MRILFVILLLLPQLSAAAVYMCVDPQTGKKSFTDRACDESASREQLHVDSANTASGAKTSRRSGNQTWNSQRDSTRDGRDYRQDERAQSGTAGAERPSGYLADSY